MKRRMFLVTAAIAASVPFGVIPSAGQTRNMSHQACVGFLLLSTVAAVNSPQLVAFRERLRSHGWLEGQTVRFEYRWAEGKTERLVDLAAELLRSDVHVIIVGAPPPALAAKRATDKIPTVLAGVSDPLALGLVDALAGC